MQFKKILSPFFLTLSLSLFLPRPRGAVSLHPPCFVFLPTFPRFDDKSRNSRYPLTLLVLVYLPLLFLRDSPLPAVYVTRN